MPWTSLDVELGVVVELVYSASRRNSLRISIEKRLVIGLACYVRSSGRRASSSPGRRGRRRRRTGGWPPLPSKVKSNDGRGNLPRKECESLT